MIKKYIWSLIFMSVVTGMCFSQGLGIGASERSLFSVGCGIIATNNIFRITRTYQSEQIAPDFAAGKKDFSSKKLTIDTNCNDIGGYLFFDATYAEMDVSFATGKAACSMKGRLFDAIKMGVSVYGKYPIVLNSLGFTISPIAGIQYDIALDATTRHGNKVVAGNTEEKAGILIYTGKENGHSKYRSGTVNDINALMIKFGASARYPVSDKFYFDTQFLWGILLYNTLIDSNERDRKDSFESLGYEEKYLFHGTTFKIAVGYVL
ncbi:MAG: hypothetical protein LBD07_03310 [Spirochaetaceae bacterium]|jgi:hypothetical protein|nr:hypothetical protein [Spirochaetaceae bacterium]